MNCPVKSGSLASALATPRPPNDRQSAVSEFSPAKPVNIRQSRLYRDVRPLEDRGAANVHRRPAGIGRRAKRGRGPAEGVLLSAEKLIEADPDVILCVGQPADAAAFAARPGIDGLRAVRQGRVRSLDRRWLVAGRISRSRWRRFARQSRLQRCQDAKIERKVKTCRSSRLPTIRNTASPRCTISAARSAAAFAATNSAAGPTACLANRGRGRRSS